MDHEIFVPHDDQERRNVRALEEYPEQHLLRLTNRPTFTA